MPVHCRTVSAVFLGLPLLLTTWLGSAAWCEANQTLVAAWREQLEATEFQPLDKELGRHLATDLLAAIRQLQTLRGERDADQLQWLGIPADASVLLEPLLDDGPLLEGIQGMLEQDFAPFEQDEYQQVLTALQRYRRWLRGREREGLAEEFQRRRELAVQLMQRWLSEGDPDAHRRLADQVIWMEEHLQGEPLVGRLRRGMSFPNLVLRVPAEPLSRLSRQTISLQEPVAERTRALLSRGTSQLNGTLRLEPLSDDAPVRLHFPGEVRVAAVSRLGGFSFPTWTTTRIDAGLNLRVTPEGLEMVDSVQVSADTRLRSGRVTSERSGPLPWIAGRVVNRIVTGRSDEAAAALNRTIAAKVREEFQRMVGEQLPRINEEFTRLLANPATRLQMRPRDWQVSAEASHLTLRLTEDRHCGLAAAAPFEPVENDAPCLALHGSFATDLLNSLFRGQNWPRDIDANGLQSFNDQLPVPLFESREFLAQPRVRLRLHARRPFSAEFHDDCVVLRLHAEQLEVGEHGCQGVALVLRFVVTAESETVRLRVASPAELEFDARDQLPDTLRTRLTEACRDELLADLKTEVEFPSVLTYGGWSLRPARLISRDGWFTLVAAVGESPLAESGEPQAGAVEPQSESAEPRAESSEPQAGDEVVGRPADPLDLPTCLAARKTPAHVSTQESQP